MSNFKRANTFQALNIGLNGRVPLSHTENFDTAIANPAAKVAIIGGLDDDGIVRALKLTNTGSLSLDADVTIEDIKVGSSDGTTADKYLKTDANGRLEIIPYSALEVTDAPADNLYGTQVGVVSNTTADIVTIASTPADFSLRGFSYTGTGDGYFYIVINGSTWYSARTSITTKSGCFVIPNPHEITPGSEVILRVKNESDSTADFEGTLLGE